MKTPTSTIFVGNLPFEVTEDQLKTLFESAGPVKSFRLVSDRDTGRPKGFGFCEFFDVATAESAHRNLNGHEIGGRSIRIDYAEDWQTKREGGGRGPGGDMPAPAAPPYAGLGSKPVGMPAAEASASMVAQLLGASASTSPEVQQQLNSAFASLSKAQLYDVMREMKALVGADRPNCRQYFLERPWLTKVLFQAQILLGMVQAPPPPVAAAADPGMQPGVHVPGYGQPPGVAYAQQPPMAGPQPGAVAGVPLGQQPPMQHQQPPPGYAVPGQPLAQPPHMQQQQQQPAAAAAPPPPGGGGMPLQDPAALQALLAQVMSLSDAQIAALAPEHRAQVMFVKDQVATGKLALPV